ncbi:cell division protein FtsZ [Blattabacterium cuenoti]|uniref:cell division protein FtsZ n=1 Tax=Blattabacterium cuenoti TaxID=1653831 RepID=UPI00163B8C6C|nr:cell division protein FtsZ [Blattabacterium cuenoti]
MKKEDFIQKKENVQFGFPKNRSAAIKVIGVGGGGSNALSHMFEQGITGVDFIACNTDAQALNNNPVPVKIQLGASITEGLGAGADPEVGEKAALESLEEIKSVLDSNTKMTFITAGMGGGTGTGAAPIIAGISKEKGILTVGIVTIPFHFEGKMRLQQAQKGIEALRKNVDSLIVINNDKLRELYGNLGFKAGFAKADEVLTTAAKGIAEVITHHYKQNIDLRDTRTVLKESGTAVMGSAISVGENRAKEAVGQALDSPLLNDNKITGAKNVLLLIVSGRIEITIDEIGIISDYIQAEAGNNANIIMGIGEDESLEESISVTIVATGFPTEIQRAINHEEKKIFHRLEEPYEQRLTKVEEIHSYSKRKDPYSSTNSNHSEKPSNQPYYKNKKEKFSLNQKKSIFDQAIDSNFVETKHKKYMMLEDSFDLPISYNENDEKIFKKRTRKKENHKNEKFNDF